LAASPSIRSTYCALAVSGDRQHGQPADERHHHLSQELVRIVEAFGYGWSDLARFTINAMKSAFVPFDERLAIIDEVIKPRFAVLVGERLAETSRRHRVD